MKNTIMLISLWVMVLPVMAQRNIDRHISFAGKDYLTMKIQIADSITVHTWNKPEVYARASVNINDNQDNEAYKVSFDEVGKTVGITAGFEDNYFKGRKNCCNESVICWEVYIPEKTAFSIETIDGNITIDGTTAGIRAKTISGFIDWAVRPDCNADLELKTISGTLYSNMEFNAVTNTNSFPQKVSQKLNQGGTPVELETISGDIFCRRFQ